MTAAALLSACALLGLAAGGLGVRVIVGLTGKRLPAPPLLFLSTAAAFVMVGWRVGLDPALPGFLLFAWTLLVIAVIDAQTRRIPNRLTYPLTPALLALLLGAALLDGQLAAAARALLGGLAAFTVLLLLALARPSGMGMGDVKLAAFIGVGLGYLGWGEIFVGVAAGFVLGGVVALIVVATRLRGPKDALPFGPYLAAGAFTALLVGRAVLDAFLLWAIPR